MFVNLKDNFFMCKKLLLHLLSILILLVFQSCESCQRKEDVPLKPVKKTIQYNESEFRSALIDKIRQADLDTTMITTWVQAIENGTYFPIVRNEKSIEQFTNVLKRANEHALDYYFKNDITNVEQDYNGILEMLDKDELSLQYLVDKEVDLRLISMKYNQALNFGVVNPKTIYPTGYYIDHNEADSTWYANEFGRKDYISYLENFQPNHIEYEKLQQAYQHFKQHPDEFWEALPDLPDNLLKKGERYEGAPQLRVKFGIQELPDTSDQKLIYDSLLVEHVKEFQADHNLQKDGVIGPSTLKLLNVSPQDIEAKIEASLERFRWNTELTFDSLLLVNIPDYHLQVFENGKRVLFKKIGVGIAAGHSTPEFIDTMKYVVVNPKWNIPYSIATNEILPNAKANPSYLQNNNYRVYRNGQEVSPYSVDWHSYNASNFPYWFVQDPGPGNALGKIKFLFPNKYNIYLHDTPSKHIFKREKRDVSHGCIRVENPFELGDFLMEGNEEYYELKNTDTNKQFFAEKKYPVFITYYTTWANDDGKLELKADVYNRDQKIIDALNELKAQNE